MNLLIETTNGRLVYLLEKDNKIIDQYFSEPTKKISDEALNQLASFLKRNHLSIQEIRHFFVTTGPGSYSGVRVGLVIVKTIKAINPEVEVSLMNSLNFQAGLGKKISIIDARGQKVFLGIYDNQKALLPPELINRHQLNETIREWETDGYQVIADFANVDYAQNFLELKSFFKLAKNVDDIQPLYLKSYL